MDVHDVGAYEVDGESRKLEPGMVMTIEPGLYIPNSFAENGVDPKWCGIGIRIEDNVVLTTDGNEILTSAAPKSVAEVEALTQA